MNKLNPKRAGEESEPRVPTDLRKALATTPNGEGQVGAFLRRSRAGALLVGWTQANNGRHINAGSRKPARCLRPESDTPNVFFYFSAPKQSKTRESGVEKCIPFGCGKAMSFDDLFRKDRPNTTLQRTQHFASARNDAKSLFKVLGR